MGRYSTWFYTLLPWACAVSANPIRQLTTSAPTPSVCSTGQCGLRADVYTLFSDRSCPKSLFSQVQSFLLKFQNNVPASGSCPFSDCENGDSLTNADKINLVLQDFINMEWWLNNIHNVTLEHQPDIAEEAWNLARDYQSRLPLLKNEIETMLRLSCDSQISLIGYNCLLCGRYKDHSVQPSIEESVQMLKHLQRHLLVFMRKLQ